MRRALPLAVLAALVGCAALQRAGLEPLRIAEDPDRPAELGILGPSPARPLGAAAFRLWARVENPNGVGLTLTEIAGDLVLEGTHAIEVDFPLGLPIPALADTTIPLDVTVGFDALPAVGDLARTAVGRGGRIDYRLEGTFAVRAGEFGNPRFGPLTLLEGTIAAR